MSLAQKKTAEEQRTLAEQQKKTAEEQRQQADDILGRAENIIGNFGQGMDLKTQQEAFALLTAGAMRDDATAMYDLGVFYQNGTGVTQDYGKAREWYEKVAAKDYAAAMSNLGALYENANGVPQDYAKAHEWYEKAAAKGYALAMSSLGMLFANGEGVPQDYAKARAHALFPNSLMIESNRAHALMFTGQDREAKALYLAHRGQTFSGAGTEQWEQITAEDFAKFRKAGLTSPMMADIEKELGISR